MNQPPSPTTGACSPRVAVIGAGAAGLASAAALVRAGLDVTVLEGGDRVAGLWDRGNTAGRSAAYRSLHLNTSKGRTEFAAFPMPAHWPDYPSAGHVAGYLRDYADRFAVTERVRFGAEVTRVTRGDEGWRVTTRGDRPERYDAVVVATGHNWDPKWPDPAPDGAFSGIQLHAHDYVDPELFTDRSVLVVGMGNSAMDIAVDASHVARKVFLSARHGVHIVPKYLFGRPSDATGARLARLPWRTRQRVAETMLRVAVGRPERYGLPAPSSGLFQNHPTISDTILHRLTHGEVLPRPGIARFDGSEVVFTDNRREDVDVVVWATGYRVTIPFLDRTWLGDDPEGLPLYKRVFHLQDPTLAFVGLMQSTGAALPVVEAQAGLVAAWLGRDYALPSPAAQRADVERSLAAARDRWGDRRPMMRIDFDDFVTDIPREIAAGRRRRATSEAGVWQPAPASTTVVPEPQEAR